MKREILISETEIAQRVKELGLEITNYYKKSGTKEIIVIGLLKGSFIFMADLVRKIHLPLEVDFLEVSSYGNETTSSGTIKITKDIKSDIKDKDVLIVEDIIDTGLTLTEIVKFLKLKSPHSISIATLLDKPSRRTKFIDVKFIGFEIEDNFVFGMGLDIAQKERNIPNIMINK